MSASETVSYDFRLYHNGELQDVVGGTSDVFLEETIEIEEAAEFTTAAVSDLMTLFPPTKTELYGEILISGNPIVYDED